MKRLNPEYVDSMRQLVNRSPYFDLLSMKIRSLSMGKARLEVRVQQKHLQPFGMVHGGVYSSIVDAAAFWAVYPMMTEGVGLTTVELKLNFLAPASDGRLIAKGKSLRVGKTLCLAEASIENESGVLVAHGLATMMILKDVKLRGEEGLPPKFLEESMKK